jgi:hypothetical protein
MEYSDIYSSQDIISDANYTRISDIENSITDSLIGNNTTQVKCINETTCSMIKIISISIIFAGLGIGIYNFIK